jgi:hypothetical protein
VSDDDVPRFELPDRGTLLVIGFAALLAFGFVGLLVPGFDLKPPPSASGAPTFAREQGTVIFGRSATGDCAVSDAASGFEAGASIWWTAWLKYALEPSAEALVIVRRDGVEISRARAGLDQSSKTIAVLCSEAPVVQAVAGTYAMEIRDVSDSVTYAAGEYRLT